MPTVHVRVTETREANFGEARGKIEAAAGELREKGGGRQWVISQSLGDPLVFEFFEGKLPENFERSVCGRVFGEAGEARWLRDAEGCLVWVSEEAAEASEGTRRRRKRERPYYLWGMYTKQKKFLENRTKGEFVYPLPEGASAAVDDRAYVVVAEYLAGKPAGWPGSLAEIENILNQPEITGHRYLRVECGRTE